MKQMLMLVFLLFLIACSLPETPAKNKITAAVVYEQNVSAKSEKVVQSPSPVSGPQHDQEILTEEIELMQQTTSPGGFGVAVTIDIPEENDSPGPSSSGTTLLKSGSFRWKAAGEVFIYQMTDGRRMLALQGFSMEPAANIHLILVDDNPLKGIDIGQLISKKGAYQYIIPSAVDLAHVNEVMLYIPHKKIVWATAVLS